MPEDGSGVIDPDVLWSCVTCGACVQQCPVDIEHVDHIVDMRRYQILVESNFPAELNQLFKGMENKGNPWNMSPNARMDWAKGLDFEVKVVGDDIESLDEVEWLFWVGCAGAYEDRAKKTTRAVAELLDMAGVSFGVLGNGETCTGDSARRAGNEFVFQGLAQQNVETFKEYKVKKVVSTCAHCFNTLKNEYKDFGIELEVVHHTQLLNRLVREGKLTPVADGVGAQSRSITYHDPCYIGRHNGVYSPPRELLEVLPGAEFEEMPRNSEKSFCCGAGGARMWMEETIGTRINENRTAEAVATGADQIAVGCPFCRVMLSDGLTAQQAKGEAREEVEVLDVAQMLLASVKGESATKLAPGGGRRGPGREEVRGDQGRARGRRRHPDRRHGHRHRGRRPGRQGQRRLLALRPRQRRREANRRSPSRSPRRPSVRRLPVRPRRRRAGARGQEAGSQKRRPSPPRPRPAAPSSTSPPTSPSHDRSRNPTANRTKRRSSLSRPQPTVSPSPQGRPRSRAAPSSTSRPEPEPAASEPEPEPEPEPSPPKPSSRACETRRSRRPSQARRRRPSEIPGRIPLRHRRPGTRRTRGEGRTGARARARQRTRSNAGRACRGHGRQRAGTRSQARTRR